MGAKIFFSAAAGGFFHREVHGDAVPADAVPLTARRHRQLLEQQATGRTIVAGADGKPDLAPLRKRSIDELRARAAARVKVEARTRILAVASLERQANDNAAIALAAIDGGTSSAEVQSAIGRRRRIDAIRAASNAIEAVIARMPTSNLTDYDASADRLWPAQD